MIVFKILCGMLMAIGLFALTFSISMVLRWLFTEIWSAWVDRDVMYGLILLGFATLLICGGLYGALYIQFA